MAGRLTTSSRTLTFLFTDIERSSARWEADPDNMGDALAAHDELLIRVVEQHEGRVFAHRGDGLAAVFDSPGEALHAAVRAQRALDLPVRMGLSTGEAAMRDDNYFGRVLNQTARLTDAGHGGQILVAASTAALVDDLDGIELIDLGDHRLRDLSGAVRLFQVQADGLRRQFPLLRTLDAARHNLPVVPTRLVGREELVVRVTDQVVAGRVTTLTGFGGVGKTRLALAAAGEVVERFAAGVFFVPLQSVDRDSGVVSAVASSVGLRLSATGGDTEEMWSVLAQFIGTRDMLVVLDNCEHRLDAVADLVEDIVSSGELGRVLATSRQPLGVDGESVKRVPPLDAEGDVGAAVELILDRAREVGYVPRADDLTALRAICARVDGIPLAIELAGAQLAFIGPDELARQLAAGFDLLEAGGGARRRRHRTLQAVMEWSWNLLDVDEQELLSHLSVFPDRFDLDAASAVGQGPSAGTIRSLGRLVAASLVEVERAPAMRYRLLEPVREYAAAKLPIDRARAAERALRDHVLEQAEVLPLDVSALSMEAEAEYARNWPNARAAVLWSIEHDEPAAASTILGAGLGAFLGGLGAPEVISMVEQVEHIGRDSLTSRESAVALLAGIQMTNPLGDYRRARRWTPAIVERAEAAGDPILSALVSVFVALPSALRSPQLGASILERGRAAALESGSVLLLNWIDTWLANMTLYAGDPEGALDGLDQVLARDVRGAGWGVAAHSSAICAALLDDVSSARERMGWYRDNPSVGVPAFQLLLTTDGEALVEAIAGDLAAARRLTLEVHQQAGNMGDGTWRGELAVLLATIAAREDRRADAIDLLDATQACGMFQPLEYFMRRRVGEIVYELPPASWDAWHGPRSPRSLDADAVIAAELAKFG